MALNIQDSDPVLKGEIYHPNKFGSIDGYNVAKLITITTLALGILGILATVGFTTYDGIYLHMLPVSNWIPMGISVGLVMAGGFGGWYCAMRRDQQAEKLKKAVEGLTPQQKTKILKKQENVKKDRRSHVYDQLDMTNPETKETLYIFMTKKSIHYFTNAEARANFMASPNKIKEKERDTILT